MSKRYPGGIIRKTPQTPSQTSAQGVWDMASVTQAVKENTWPIAGVPDPISKSLRFRSSASAYLNRTPASAGNRQKWTWSGWVKRGALSSGSYMDLFTALSGASDFTEVRYHFNANDDTLVFTDIVSGTTYAVYSTNVYRDASAWYHIVCSVDTTQATNTNRVKLYVNGVQVTQNAGGSGYPLQNTNTSINAAVEHRHGGIATYGRYFDGYMTEINFIDGQALTPSSFGNTNDQTGVWQPIAYTGTYGTNGFYLPFSNTASTTTLGYDFSGNSNNWTTNNISLTSGSTYDSMNDVPTQWIPYNTAGDTGALFRGNYATLNPLFSYTGLMPTSGNLSYIANSGNWRTSTSTISVTSGKWYCEFLVSGLSGGGTAFGIVGSTDGPTIQAIISTDNTVIGRAGQVGYAYLESGNKYTGGSSASYGASYTSNDVIGVALDLDAGTLVFYKNGVSQGTAFSSLSGTFAFACSVYSTVTVFANFGQRPFSYTPPAGFKTLCTTNLSTPTIGATASTTANKYFDATTYTGTGSSLAVTNSGSMQPDFVWAKGRSVAYDNGLFDTNRGATVMLVSNSTGAEGSFGDVSQTLTAFNSNGFTVGSNGTFNQSSATYVAWQWRASNTTAVTNTAGSITSTVSANTTSGFSIVTYTGTGSAATIGHGLGVAPSMVIVKSRSTTGNWNVYHANQSATPQNGILYLNLVDAFFTLATWNNTAPTSSVFSINGSGYGVNNSSVTYVAYCFAQVAGYSAFGSYTGNASTDGPFIFTGFRPRYIMIKSTIETSNWFVYDTARSTYNQINTLLLPSTSQGDYTDSTYGIDAVSNGFKIRGVGQYGGLNQSGGNYIYMAFAEAPFKYALAR